MVIDHNISYIGSFNFDPRSMHLNTEIGIFIEDSAFAKKLETNINRLKTPPQHLDSPTKRPPPQKTKPENRMDLPTPPPPPMAYPQHHHHQSVTN